MTLKSSYMLNHLSIHSLYISSARYESGYIVTSEDVQSTTCYEIIYYITV